MSWARSATFWGLLFFGLLEVGARLLTRDQALLALHVWSHPTALARGQQLALDPRPAPLVVGGDSTAERGVDACVLGERLGQEGLNLAIPSGSLGVLQRYLGLRSGVASVDRLVVVSSLVALTRDNPTLPLSFGEQARAQGFANALVGEVLALYGRRALLRSVLESQRQPARFDEEIGGRGRCGLAIHKAAADAEQSKQLVALYERDWELARSTERLEANESQVREALAAARGRAREAVLVVAPQHAEMNRYFEQKWPGHLGRARQVWARAGAAAGARVLDCSEALDDPSHYYDPFHLNAEGRAAFTRCLGDHLAGTRACCRELTAAPRLAMPFHSAAFLLLLLPTFALYWLLPSRYQHLVLSAASLVFYYYAGLLDTALLLGAVASNHVLSGLISPADGGARKRWLGASVALNLGILAFFKYRGFLVENFNLLTGRHAPVPSDEIPLGISFYIFQLIAYQVDLYRRQIEREPRFWRVLLYILFFPHHQAGPIMRPAAFLPQFYGGKAWDQPAFRVGMWWIFSGLIKKVASDAIAPAVDEHFAQAAAGVISTSTAWKAALKFGFQIYGDFSGYSEIAIGLGMLFGYRLDLNFRQPYVSADPSEFWRRWHITLSQWLRDYLYISLGGNRKGPVRTYVNLFMTMLLGGLWHGASWMFVLWGTIHGLLLIFHRRFPQLFAFRPLGVLVTFVAVHAAWVPFRASNMEQAGRILRSMFVPTGGEGLGAWVRLGALVGALVVFYATESWVRDRIEQVDGWWQRVPAPVRGLTLALVTALVITNLSSKTSFIYFRF